MNNQQHEFFDLYNLLKEICNLDNVEGLIKKILYALESVGNKGIGSGDLLERVIGKCQFDYKDNRALGEFWDYVLAETMLFKDGIMLSLEDNISEKGKKIRYYLNPKYYEIKSLNFDINF